MGNCQEQCSKTFFYHNDVKIDEVYNKDTKYPELIEKIYKNNLMCKVIFLQTRIKRLLRKIKNPKISIVLTPLTDNAAKAAANKDNSNKIAKDNVNDKSTNITSTNAQNPPQGGGFIVIPSVRPEIGDNSIFSNDAFKKGIRDPNNQVDPRNGPFDNVRRKFGKIIEEESSYEGEWKNGKRDGFGILCWKDISKYIGNFVDDKVSGFGKLKHEDGDIYVGYWDDFQAQGIGYYKTKREASYEGYWVNDKQSGFGIENWPRGSNYIGEYVEGFKEGIGTLNFEGNGGYEGEFQGGSISGIGMFYFKDKRKYEGEWKNNKMHGHGIISWPDGKFFEGEFVDDKKEGFGVFYSERKIYMGMWKNSSLDGDIIIFERGRIKKQYWENGRLGRNLPNDHPIFFERYVDEIAQYGNRNLPN